MKKKIIIGSVLFIVILLLLPSLSAINSKLDTNENGKYPGGWIFYVGIISNSGEQGVWLNFHAIFVLCIEYYDASRFPIPIPYLLINEQSAIIHDDFTGYIGPNFICGVFSY